MWNGTEKKQFSGIKIEKMPSISLWLLQMRIKTCLWLKGLPELTPTNIVEIPPRKKFDSGKTMPSWYAEAWHLPKEERAKLRSKTFPGIAKAMAEQWAWPVNDKALKGGEAE